MTATSLFLLVVSAFPPAGWPSSHHIVEAISSIFKYNCEHLASVSGADKDDTQHVALQYHIVATRNLLDLSPGNPVASDVGHVPGVPDQPTNEGHGLKLL
jgi:hypothetical protein